MLQAAQVVAKHPDDEHVQLLIESASLVAGSPVLPERDGHEGFALTREEEAQEAADEFDLKTAEIPRPKL